MGAIYVHTGGNLFFIRRKLQFHTEETTRLRGEYLVLGMRFAFYFGCLPLSLLVLVGMSYRRSTNLYLKLKCK